MPKRSIRATRWSRTRACKLLIDPKAVLFLLGTEMDFKVDKLSAGFVFNKSQPDLGLRLRRVGGAHAGDRPDEHPRARSMDATIVEMFSPSAGHARRMFGGVGVYADGTASRRRPREGDDPV